MDEQKSDNSPSTSRRGFASMSAERRREVASSGGKTAHRLGKAHVFTAEEASAAGKKGGSTISQDSAHMSAIGRAGINRRWARVREAAVATAQSTEAPPS